MQLYEFLGKRNFNDNDQITLYERTVLNYASVLNRPFQLTDVERCLGRSEKVARKVLKKLLDAKRIRPLYADRIRNHAYVLEQKEARKWDRIYTT